MSSPPSRGDPEGAFTRALVALIQEHATATGIQVHQLTVGWTNFSSASRPSACLTSVDVQQTLRVQ